MKMEEKPWSDLHFDLVSLISDRLGLIDLLSFRAVCNYWRSSSSNSSAEIESSVPRPWFLLQGDETGQCSILTNDNRIYRIEIPEMDESTCLASFVGWLLLYSKNSNSLFFFCPFSRAKIEIPQCPLISEQSKSESDLFAAFSSYPTDPDCTVVVLVQHKNDSKLKLCMLRRGESEWTFHKYNVRSTYFDRIKSVAVQERAFHFLDKCKGLVAFEYDTMTWMNYVIMPKNEKSNNTTDKRLNYWIDRDGINKESFSSKSDEMKQLLGIEDPCSISICGAMVVKGDANDHVISHEFVEGDDDNEESNKKPHRELKGVWFQPRFHQISGDQRW